MQLLIATHNPAKTNEYKQYLADLPLEIVSLNDLKIKEEAVEDAPTFEENAKNKALFYHQLTGLSVLADDSGLTVDALNGEPGVKSRRWKGYKMTDEEMLQSVMEAMKDVPDKQRTCHLVAIIALALPDGEVKTTWAQIGGIVAQKPTNKRLEGFPYRSFFWLPQFNKFYIDLTDAEHEQINHRKFALLKLRPYLEQLSK